MSQTTESTLQARVVRNHRISRGLLYAGAIICLLALASGAMTGCDDTPAAAASASEQDITRLRSMVKASLKRDKDESLQGVAEVLHILIQHKDGGTETRKLKEAEERAAEVYRRVAQGEDFEKLRQEFCDDTRKQKEQGRDAQPYKVQGMVADFMDVSLRLKVGEVGVCDYNADSSPFGWHIIKRVE